MSKKNYDNLRPSTLEKWKSVAREYTRNNYNGPLAYQTIYPKANWKTATREWSDIFHCPQIQEYLQQIREDEYRMLMIDRLRINSELAKMAFSPIDADNPVTPSVKVQCLKLLQDDIKTSGVQQQEEIIIGVDDDEDSSEEESV